MPKKSPARAGEKFGFRNSGPGNVRELENEMQRARALVEAGEPVTARHLSPNLSDALAPIEANVASEDSLRDNIRRVSIRPHHQSSLPGDERLSSPAVRRPGD